jgi:hypothetical protein
MAVEVAHAFHAMWSKAVGEPGYAKSDWKELETLACGHSIAAGATACFGRLQALAKGQSDYNEGDWRRLEALLFGANTS